MAKRLNVSAAWIRLALYLTALVAAVAIAYGQIGHAVDDNTGFRTGDIKRDMEEIKIMQRQILEEVRK